MPDGSCGRPEGWAAHLSPVGCPAGCALLFGLAPGGVCPFHSVGGRSRRRHRHCGTGPRLATGGRYPPPCAAELGLSSRPSRGRPRRGARPSDGLADGAILAGKATPTELDRRVMPAPPAGQVLAGRPGQPIRSRAVRPAAGRRSAARPPPRGRWPRCRAHRRGCSGPAAHGSPTSDRSHGGCAAAASQSGISFASLTRQRPASCSTISFESSSIATSPGTELRGQREGPDDGRVLGDVVRLDPEELGDRRVRRGPRVAGVGPGKVDQDGSRRRGSGVAARRAVRPDEEIAQTVASPDVGRRIGRLRRAPTSGVGGVLRRGTAGVDRRPRGSCARPSGSGRSTRPRRVP